MKELGIYIHIPFCKKKCDYCDFISFCDKTEQIEEYINVLKEEIRNSLINKEYKVTTIYIGGGTPSFIDSKYITEILKLVKEKFYIENAEITIELNPGTVTKEKLLDYKKAGINRLSIGLQETNNELLKQIGRIHTYEEFLETYNLARKLEFKNINIDLMIGLPNQSIQNIKEDLNKIIALNPEHISVYSLILEEGTKLYQKYENNEINLPNEELERNMYWYVKNTLENNGYKHYEISNFSKKGYESKHNMNCWEQKEYLGFGLSAHSYINGTRYSNEMTQKGQTPLGHFSNEGTPNGQTTLGPLQYHRIIHEEQNLEDMQKEYMLLGLRKIHGVSIQKFEEKFVENPIFLFRNELKKLVEQGLLEIDGDKIRLTNKGLDLANIVWEEFV